MPVLVRYGATDVLVPPAHGEYLAPNVPGCVVKVDDTAGHLSTNPEQEIAENIHWLRDDFERAVKLLQLAQTKARRRSLMVVASQRDLTRI